MFMAIVCPLTELPWDEPTSGCAEFLNWKHDDSWMTITPWNKMENIALSLLRKILEPDSTKRITLDKIINHKWCKMYTSGESSNKNRIFYSNSNQKVF